MSKSPTALASLARYAVVAAEELGLTSAPLLAEAGLTGDALKDPDGRVPVKRLLRLWELAAQESGDPLYGLHVAERVASPQTVHVVGFAARSAATLGEAIGTVGRFASVMNETTAFELARGRRVSTLVVEPRAPHPPWPRVYAEVVLGGYLRVGRMFAGAALECERATFQHAPPPSRSEYERFFGKRLEFSAPHNSLSFATSALDLPIQTADSALFSYFHTEAARMLEQLPEVSAVRERVRKAVSDRLADGAAIGAIAPELGMSTRTLQRVLREEGVTFEEVRDEVRREVALKMVGDRRFSLAEIGALVGYADGSAFRAAFRRWTRQSPRQAREAARGEAAPLS